MTWRAGGWVVRGLIGLRATGLMQPAGVVAAVGGARWAQALRTAVVSLCGRLTEPGGTLVFPAGVRGFFGSGQPRLTTVGSGTTPHRARVGHRLGGGARRRHGGLSAAGVTLDQLAAGTVATGLNGGFSAAGLRNQGGGGHPHQRHQLRRGHRGELLAAGDLPAGHPAAPGRQGHPPGPVSPERIHRVGVVADTHVGDALPALPDGVLTALRGCDLIIHAGDVTGPGVLDRLGEIAPVVAVRGNHDHVLARELPRDLVVRIGGARIGVTHGLRNPVVEVLMGLAGVVLARPVTWGLPRALLRRVGRVDCLVFGHFHMHFARRVRGTLVFSPGAVYVVEADPGFRGPGLRGAAFRRFRRGLPPGSRAPAVGVLTVRDGEVSAEVVPVEGPIRHPPPEPVGFSRPSVPRAPAWKDGPQARNSRHSSHVHADSRDEVEPPGASGPHPA
ncbi:MAG: YfcE family phosphodiesterase [Thermoleophilia bacterium]